MIKSVKQYSFQLKESDSNEHQKSTIHHVVLINGKKNFIQSVW